MKLKKILSLTMALAMAFALAIPALAQAPSPQTVEAAGGTGTTINSSASGYSGSINITLNPNTIVLNPYQLKATIGEGNAAQSSYHQIFAPAVSCVNKSTFGLKVNAKVSAAASTGVNLVTSAPKDTATEKDVFLYAEFGVSNSATTEPTWETVFNAKTASQMLVGAQPADEFKTVATLNATGGTTDTTGKSWNYLWYKFDGAAAKSPTNGWTAENKVTPALVLSFQPTVDTVYAVSVVNTTSKTAAGTVKLNFDIAPAGETIKVTCTPDPDINPQPVPTVTATQGSTKLTVEDNAFTMPAGDVTVTVKWAAGS
jgi:hypothetical protein